MDARDQFVSVVDDIYGLYLDAMAGFQCWRRQIDAAQKQISGITGLTLEEINGRRFTYGKGDPDTSGSHSLHERLQGEIKERTKKEGKNCYDVAKLCLVLIFQYWEDYYRQEIARECGVQKNNVCWNVMGDIGYLRESIIHHQGVAKNDVKKCKILQGFKPGRKISINEQQMEDIITSIKSSKPEIRI